MEEEIKELINQAIQKGGDLQTRLDEALDALEMLVDKCDEGMARSKETYALHVKVLRKNGRKGGIY